MPKDWINLQLTGSARKTIRRPPQLPDGSIEERLVRRANLPYGISKNLLSPIKNPSEILGGLTKRVQINWACLLEFPYWLELATIRLHCWARELVKLDWGLM